MARMRTMLCVVLVATGCYSPGYVDCEVTCGVSGTCPDGLDCLGGVCRVGGNTGLCGVPNSDGRTDDATDSGSNIDGPVVSAGDEDQDGVPNGMDKCPISANNDDADGDGVGDACEQPTGTPTDTLVLFEGFDSAPGTAMVVGTWSFSTGSARIVSSTNVASSVTFVSPIPANHRTTVIAKVRLEAPQITSADATSAGVVARTDGGASGIECGLGRDPGTSNDALMLLKLAAAADLNFRSVAATASTGTTQVVTTSRNPSNEIYSCALPGNVIAFTAPSPAPTGTRVGIRTRSMNASFEWLMVIESPQ